MVRSHLIPMVIAGPTACGKSSLALSIAERHNGEIICADSRQFYAGMAIGTACPSPKDLERIPHHGYGAFDPKSEKMDAGSFVAFAKKTISSIQERNKRPILVGGTGLYLRALRYGLAGVPPSDPLIAKALSDRCDEIGTVALHAELAAIDRGAADQIEKRDRYRIIRALEIHAISGQSPSSLRVSFLAKKPDLSAHWALKAKDRASLARAIDSRVDRMFELGLVEEAKCLRERLPSDHWTLSVMGYREALMHADGFIDENSAKRLIAIRHRQYAKRQLTWFKKEEFYRFAIA